MTVNQIYTHFRIPKNLQRHMLTAAAVGGYIAANYNRPVERDRIVSALLLHDLGNLLKFDLKKSLALFDKNERNLGYWSLVKREMIAKYSSDEHTATVAMAKEIGTDQSILLLLGDMGSANLHKVIKSNDWELKIVTYADFRVGPHGLVSVTERFEDIIKRYKGRKHLLADKDQTLIKRELCLKLEKQLQTMVSIPLENLPEQDLAITAQELKERVIHDTDTNF